MKNFALFLIGILFTQTVFAFNPQQRSLIDDFFIKQQYQLHDKIFNKVSRLIEDKDDRKELAPFVQGTCEVYNKKEFIQLKCPEQQFKLVFYPTTVSINGKFFSYDQVKQNPNIINNQNLNVYKSLMNIIIPEAHAVMQLAVAFFVVVAADIIVTSNSLDNCNQRIKELEQSAQDKLNMCESDLGKIQNSTINYRTTQTFAFISHLTEFLESYNSPKSLTCESYLLEIDTSQHWFLIAKGTCLHNYKAKEICNNIKQLAVCKNNFEEETGNRIVDTDLLKNDSRLGEQESGVNFFEGGPVKKAPSRAIREPSSGATP